MRFHNLFERYVNCPAGSNYYVCASSNYSGCCKIDACTGDDGCPASASVQGTTIGAAATPTTAAVPTATLVETTSSPAVATTDAQPTTAPETTFYSSYTPQATTSTTPDTTASSLATTTKDATKTGTSTGGDRVSVTTAIATATTTITNTVSSGSKFPTGAIAGVVAGVVVLALLAAAFFFWRRKKQAQRKRDSANDGSDGHMLGGGSQGGPTPAMSPMGEKGLFHSSSPMSQASTPGFGGEGFVHPKAPVEMSGSPANSAVLYGELEGSYAGYGYGRKVYPSIAELDDAAQARAELETPLPTPQSTPQIGSDSPNLSLMSGSQGGRSTLVSSWRSSSRTTGADTIAEERLANVSQMSSPTLGAEQEQLYVPLVYDARGEAPTQEAQQPQQQQEGQPTRTLTDSPRPNLDLSQTERGNGVHVASWNAYRG